MGNGLLRRGNEFLGLKNRKVRLCGLGGICMAHEHSCAIHKYIDYSAPSLAGSVTVSVVVDSSAAEDVVTPLSDMITVSAGVTIFT
jgi:hypothetical protein